MYDHILYSLRPWASWQMWDSQKRGWCCGIPGIHCGSTVASLIFHVRGRLEQRCCERGLQCSIHLCTQYSQCRRARSLCFMFLISDEGRESSTRMCHSRNS